ncbi:MAG: GNAT family N-acetyltransferase [Bacteroidetes bacterium]|nr:GNAT family N-acetyltransferase [Bacteroidota bacterium]
MKIELGTWGKEDIPGLVKYANDIKIWNTLRDIFPHPYTKTDADQWIALNELISPPHNFAIRVDGETIGGAGVTLKNDVYKKNAEIGYWIAEPFWGKGIATKVVSLLTIHAFANFDINRIYAEVFSNNPVSMKVLKKNGYHEEAVHRKAIIKNNQFLDAHLWVRFKPEEQF